MTDEAKALVEECRLDAKAFRENTVYDSDGDPIRLIANADRLDQYADRIEALEAALSWALIQLGSETGYNMESPIWHAYDCARSVLNGEK